MTTDQALTILQTGLTTFDEQHEIAALIKDLEQDANRYRWLTKYTAHLFMCKPEGLDEQMNRAMGKKDETQDT
jgi:hypothetical protein